MRSLPLIHPEGEDLSMTTGRTVGAAIGALLFVLFFAFLSGRLIVTSSAADHQVAANIR